MSHRHTHHEHRHARQERRNAAYVNLDERDDAPEGKGADPVDTAPNAPAPAPSDNGATVQAGGAMPAEPKDTAGAAPVPSAAGSAGAQRGLDGGAKAGIAIGVILGVGLIAGLLFLWFRYKKQSKAPLVDNEKTISDKDSLTASAAPPAVQEKALPTPPRPVRADDSPRSDSSSTSADEKSDSSPRDSVTSESSVSSTTVSRNLTGNEPPPYSPPVTPPKDHVQNPFSDLKNPFDNHAEAPAPAEVVRPFISPMPPVSPVFSEFPLLESGTVAENENSAAATAPTTSEMDKSSEVRTAPSSVDNDARTLTPVSPSNEDAAPLSPEKIAAAAAAIGPGPSNVHRVQMDFTPTMSDELELRVGQLVRVMHEYDDGWVCTFLFLFFGNHSY